MCANLPAHYEVDYVRVYQNTAEPTHKVGCSTDTRPTKKFIEGHRKRYFDPYNDETQPLSDQVVGGGKCKRDSDCGPTSSCADGACACSKKYTGPHCRAAAGFDDVDWEPAQTLAFHGPIIPAPLARSAALLATALAAVLARHILARRDARKS